jgi:hypothetical protein
VLIIGPGSDPYLTWFMLPKPLEHPSVPIHRRELSMRNLHGARYQETSQSATFHDDPSVPAVSGTVVPPKGYVHTLGPDTWACDLS